MIKSKGECDPENILHTTRVREEDKTINKLMNPNRGVHLQKQSQSLYWLTGLQQ